MASGHLRRRGGVYWFRRRVPDLLTERLGRQEIHRSLRTYAYNEAVLRSKIMWINSERVFKTMALHPNLVAAQARALINQLLDEPLMGSETFDALVESCASDSVLGKQLFNRTAVGLVMDLPDEAREKIGLQMSRIVDQAELAVTRQRRELDAMKARAALHRARLAIARADKAEAELAKARAALRAAQCQAVPTPEAAPPLADAALPAKARPLPPAPGQPETMTAPKPRGCPLWSAFVPLFLNEKTRKAEDHKPYDAQTVRQTEATMHLWTAFLGDRPVNAYDGSDAATFRDMMLRLPASHGKNEHHGTLWPGGTASRRARPYPARGALSTHRARAGAWMIDSDNAVFAPLVGDARDAAVPLIAASENNVSAAQECRDDGQNLLRPGCLHRAEPRTDRGTITASMESSPRCAMRR
jgi:hypothetical protein